MLLVALIALLPASVSAHASLIGTDPADGAALDEAPAQVTLSFTEPVDLVEGSYRLFNSTGSVATLETETSGSDVLVMLPPKLPDGSYVVDWRVISLDSHPISGAVMFSVGEPGAAPVNVPEMSDIAPAMGAIQGIGYVALLAGVGLLLFRAAVIQDINASTIRAVTVAAIVAVIAHLLLVPLTAIHAAGKSLAAIFEPEMWRVGVTHPTVIATALVAIGFAVALAAARVSRVALAGVLSGGMVALVSLPIVGHTRSVEPAWLMYTSDLVHGLVGALWFGGLIGLGWYLLREGRSGPVAGARVVTRFSVVAGLAFALAATSGAVMAFRIIDGPDALTGTTYGRIFLAKLALILIPFGLATWNRLQLVPAVERARDATSAWNRLRGSVTAEAALLLVVVGLTGFLVFQSPNASSVAAGNMSATYEETVVLGDGTVGIRITPGAIGENEMVIDVRDEAGQPVELVDAPVVEISLPAEELGPLTYTLPEGETPGEYAGMIQFPLAGDWDVSVVTRTSRFEQSTMTVAVPIP